MLKTAASDFGTHRATVLWLYFCCILVGAMVILGGLTRLTHSGLSMVDWQPLNLLPPFGDAEWQAAFERYRTSPEFRLVNSGFTLAEFKGIFWLEYTHRLWGRLIGFAFAIPLLWLIAMRRIDRRLGRRLVAIFLLGALQGVVGWLMVKSGLGDIPSVSHYRLAAHLLLALAILAAILWTALDLRPAPTAPQPQARALFLPVLGFSALLTVSICWGAFTAGLGAGHIHNSFPLMDGALFPKEGLIERPLLLNFVANPATVQFVHRWLAMATVSYASILWLVGRSKKPGCILDLLAGWCWGQAALGVLTLLLGVPLALGLAHQAGALVLFCLTIALLHRLRASKPTC
jgi:cytochrome c oxidase assembly protein subunit 15